MIFRMPQLAVRDTPKLARDLDMVVRRKLEAAALHQPHDGVDDGFRREAVAHFRFEPEDVAGQMKCADLASPVGQQLVGANRAADDLVEYSAGYPP
jgi:hypothetical protein